MINKFMGSGRITNDLQIVYTQSNKKYLQFNIAINDGTKEKPHTTFIPCVAWEKRAEVIAQYFSKGDQIIIEGRLSISTYDDRGEKRSRANIVVENFDWGAKKQNNVAAQPKPQTQPQSNNIEYTQVVQYDDITPSYDIPNDDYPF